MVECCRYVVCVFLVSRSFSRAIIMLRSHAASLRVLLPSTVFDHIVSFLRPRKSSLTPLDFICRELEGIVAAHVDDCGRCFNTGHTNSCVHVQQVVGLLALYRRSGQFTFPCVAPVSYGNSWILNSVLPRISPFSGKHGRRVLEVDWKIRFDGAAEQQEISSGVVRSMLAEFLDNRSVGSFEEYFGEDIQALVDVNLQGYEDVRKRLVSSDGVMWFRVPFKDSVMYPPVVRSGNHGRFERAWHGFKWESLASMLLFGLRGSGPDDIGTCSAEDAGLYCCSDAYCSSAAGYCNNVPSGNSGLFWSCLWELSVDRDNGLIPCGRKGQWQQKISSVFRTALFVRVARYGNVPLGEPIQAFWEPLFEFPCVVKERLLHVCYNGVELLFYSMLSGEEVCRAYASPDDPVSVVKEEMHRLSLTSIWRYDAIFPDGRKLGDILSDDGEAVLSSVFAS